MNRGARTLTKTILLATALLFVVLEVVARLVDSEILRYLASLALACCVLVALIWAFRVAWRRFLWRVGRRLAFSYFLVGVLPIALLALIFLLTAYLLGGFLLGHLYRDALDDLGDELITAADTRLADLDARRGELPETTGALRFAEYRDGRRVQGSAEAPAGWPAWLEALQEGPAAHGRGLERRPFVALADGRVTAAAAARAGRRGVVVWFDGDLDRALRERTRVWLQLLRSDDPRRKTSTRLQVFNQEIRLRGLWFDRSSEQSAEYYRLSPPKGAEPAFWERPTIVWMESTGELPRLADGASAAESVGASMAASPTGLFQALLSTSAEVDSSSWVALLGVSVLFAEIYLVAAAIALFMIFGLSSAVNRLSRATEAIGRGDFSTRIPVRRRDQLGDLQRSFNDMSEHLEELVQTAAQKEVLDKELAMAREVQQNLLPAAIDARPGVDFSTYFEPSAAIGGDYFDLLDAGGGKVAVVIADVAGHGLPAGLRMALVKSALTLLVEDLVPPPQAFARLHRLLKNRTGDRGFVTASLSLFDPATGLLALTNAAHPPAYLVRGDGSVEEVQAPGVPLGAMAGAPGEARRELSPGDAVVWLSDGLIESRSEAGELFGYEAIRRALSGPPRSAESVRDQLLAAVRAHAGERPPEDDRTLVVMLYREAVAGSRPR